MDRLPDHHQRVIARYDGVYTDRLVTFWNGERGSYHFGRIDEPDGKGSQPATHWMPFPELAVQTHTPPTDSSEEKARIGVVASQLAKELTERMRLPNRGLQAELADLLGDGTFLKLK
jgi:hypothetical protein